VSLPDQFPLIARHNIQAPAQGCRKSTIVQQHGIVSAA
jgi:hypothetical protein